MSEKTENGDSDGVIDPDLKEELEETPVEDPFLTEYTTGEGSNENESLRFVEQWFPDENEWKGKTNITPKQAHALSAVRNIPRIFEEIEELEPFLESMVEDYEMYLTSIDGESRNQQVDILRTLFGGLETDESESRSALMSAFANNVQEEKNE